MKSHFPELQIEGDSTCDDVVLMREALQALRQNRTINAGLAGTVLRFMALRASREPGKHRIEGERRLFERPQEDLVKILRQLSVRAELGPNFIEIEGEGWKLQGDTLLIPTDKSSQFATAVLLNAWDLPFDLYVATGAHKVSQGYWHLTTKLMQQLGMKIDFWDGDFRVPARQKLVKTEVHCESDVSSAFAVAAVAAVNGQAMILDFPFESLQPDVSFINILPSMGVKVTRADSKLKIEKAARLNGVRVSLNNTPDLFPVLAALCALSEGESDLYGAPHLIHKESNRLQKMADILKLVGRTVEVKDDGLRIKGPVTKPGAETLTIDCEGDHRLAFAAAVLKGAGWPIKIIGADSVNKSFPQFWSVLGWSL